MKTKDKKFNSKVIHSGHGADETTGAVMPPIHLSSTFTQNSTGDFTYACQVDRLTCSTDLNTIYKMCNAGNVFRQCINRTSSVLN